MERFVLSDRNRIVGSTGSDLSFRRFCEWGDSRALVTGSV